MHILCTPVGFPSFQAVTSLSRKRYFVKIAAGNCFLDIILSIMVITRMARLIVKVAAGNSSFRIVIPQKLVKEMGWNLVEYVAIRKCSLNSLEIRRIFDDKDPEKQDH